MLSRITRPLVIVVGLAGAGLSTPAFAEWRTNYETARDALSHKDFRNAENAAIEALNEAEAFGKTDSRRLATLETLSDIYRETRQWAAAAQLLEQVLEAMKELGTDQSQDAGYVWNKLGVAYQQMRENDKAQSAYETALAIKRKKFKENATSIAIVITNLGELYRRKKDWPKAEELHKQAIADKENELGPEHPTLVASLNNLALVYKETKRYDEAVALLTRAQEIAKKGDNGGNNADMATALSNMGDVLSIQGKNQEARGFYERAVTMRKEVLGQQHPNVAETLNNFGGCLMGLNLFEEAIRVYDEAIEIRKLEFGATDSRTILVMSNKAMALDRLKRYEDATRLRDEIKALEARRQNQTP